MRDINSSGPCMCGATDCPSCGPAQGYTLIDEETFDEELAALVRQKGQNLAAITAAQYAWGAGAGVVMSGFAAIGAALFSIALVIVVLGFAKNPALRLIALALFAVPAVIAGYALVYGITKNAIDSGLVLNLLGGMGGLVIGISAIVNLNALGESVFSR